MDQEPKYVIVTPARDEAEHIERTLISVTQQTIKPIEWVVVDDGSEDQTATIVKSYVGKYPWIKLIRRENRGFRKAGGGVVDTFYDGFDSLGVKDWQFLVKLDGDLSFGPDYFEKCFEYFANTSRLGIGGGIIYHLEDGKAQTEETPRFHVRGATKVYRKECWDALGGLIRAPGWDTVDEVKANMLGWETKSFPELRLLHLRHTGAAAGPWQDSVKGGKANYIAGYHPLFILARCIRRLFRKPYLIYSLGLLYGYFRSYILRLPKVDDPALVKFVRQQQLRKLLLMKTIWK